MSIYIRPIIRALLHTDTLRIGPPRGGHDRRHITCPHRWFSTILSDFCINGVSKATPGATKVTRFYGFSQVGRRRAFFTIARPSFIFFVVILWWIFSDFDVFFIHCVSKATPGTTKMNAFWCIFASQATACVFDHCNIDIHYFSWSFCSDFRCISASFCMILDTRLEAWSPSTNGPWSTSKCVIFITFWSVFDPAKIKLTPALCGFPEKITKTWSRNNESFSGRWYMDIVFLYFLRDLEKMICEAIGE